MTDDYIDHPYPLAVKRFPELRQSLLSSFDSCSLASYFETEYRRGWATHPQARGQLFHRFAAECLRAMNAAGEDEIPVDAALAILADVLRQDDADRRCPKCGSEKIRPGIDAKTCQRTCSNGHKFDTQLVNVPIDLAKELHWIAVKWAHENSFDIGNLVDVEQRLRATVRYPDRRRGGTVPRVLTGQIDAMLVEGTERAIVIDWKDTWGAPPEETVSFGGYFQQRFYAWLIFQNYPTVQEVVLREFYVRYSETREAVVHRVDDTVSEMHDELAALAERFDRMWQQHLEVDARRRTPVAADRQRRWGFVPTPGKWCSYCIRPMACPIPQFARGEGRITTPARASEVARQLLAAEATVKQARDALKAYSDVNGPIEVKAAKGARALGFVATTRTERPSLEAIEALERELGRPPSSREIRDLYKTKKSKKFMAHTPADVDEGQLEEKVQEQLRASIEAAQARARELPREPTNVVPLRRNGTSGAGRRVAAPDQRKK